MGLVIRANGDGLCTLREAIRAANNAATNDCSSASSGNDTIILQSGQTYTLSLKATAADEDTAAEGDLDIAAAGTLIIQGNGATIRRDPTLACTIGTDEVGEFRIFDVHSGGNLTLQDVRVTNGCADGSGTDRFGGGIYNNGTATIQSSTLSGNSAFNGGGIVNFFGTVTLNNTIVANSPSGGNCSNSGTFNASGVNFATDGTCPGFTSVTPAQLNLGPLAVNAPATTATHALLASSVAIDAATDCALVDGTTPVTQDQRGVARSQGPECDVGAYEAVVVTLFIVGSGSGSVTSSPAAISCTIGAGTASGDCSKSASPGSNPTLALTATPAAGSTFAGWSGHPDCSDGSVTINTSKLCIATFNLATGTIVIVKDIVPDDSQDFEFSRSFGANFFLDDDADATLSNTATFTGVTAGSPTVTELGPPAGFALNIVCSDLSGGTTVNLTTRTATIELAAGETVTCTFTNTRVGVSLFVLQGNGHCLEVDRDRRIYRFRAANGRVFTGPLTFTQRGSKLTFQSPLLKGTIDLNRRTGSAPLVVPLSQGGGRYVITDRNIDDNGACP